MMIITDDKEAKVSLKIKNDPRIDEFIALLVDSGYWVHKQAIITGESEIWIDLKAQK